MVHCPVDWVRRTILESDELKQLPIFGSLIKISRAAASIKERLFARKVYKFLVEISNVPLDQRKAFIDDLDKTPDGQRRVGESIILLLERIDDMEKASIIGKIYRQCMLGYISNKQSLRLSAIVDRVFIMDLHDLVHFHEKKSVNYGVCAALSGAGLLEVTEIVDAH